MCSFDSVHQSKCPLREATYCTLSFGSFGHFHSLHSVLPSWHPAFECAQTEFVLELVYIHPRMIPPVQFFVVRDLNHVSSPNARFLPPATASQ